MNRRDFLLFPLSLAGCASLPGVAAVPTFGRFTSTPKSGRISAEVVFHDPDKVRAVCKAINGRSYPDGKAPSPPACVTDTYTPGHDTIHVAMPRDWDDHEVLIQLAHELLHSLGGNHA